MADTLSTDAFMAAKPEGEKPGRILSHEEFMGAGDPLDQSLKSDVSLWGNVKQTYKDVAGYQAGNVANIVDMVLGAPGMIANAVKHVGGRLGAQIAEPGISQKLAAQAGQAYAETSPEWITSPMKALARWAGPRVLQKYEDSPMGTVMGKVTQGIEHAATGAESLTRIPAEDIQAAIGGAMGAGGHPVLRAAARQVPGVVRAGREAVSDYRAGKSIDAFFADQAVKESAARIERAKADAAQEAAMKELVPDSAVVNRIFKEAKKNRVVPEAQGANEVSELFDRVKNPPPERAVVEAPPVKEPPLKPRERVAAMQALRKAEAEGAVEPELASAVSKLFNGRGEELAPAEKAAVIAKVRRKQGGSIDPEVADLLKTFSLTAAGTTVGIYLARKINEWMAEEEKLKNFDPQNENPVPEANGNYLTDAGMLAGAAGIFVPSAKGHPNTLRALRLEKAGTPREAIWKQTGLFKGADGTWRREISDEKAKLNSDLPRNQFDKNLVSPAKMFEATKLSDILDHPELYRVAPDLKDIPVRSTGMAADTLGAWSEKTGNMYLAGGKPDNVLSTTLHELQHVKQGQEGMNRGGSPEQFLSEEHKAEMASTTRALTEARKALEAKAGYFNPYTVLEAVRDRAEGKKLFEYQKTALEKVENLPEFADFKQLIERKAELDKLNKDAFNSYKRLGGEVEARAVQARRAMTAAERRAIPPWKSFDVPEADWIIRHAVGGAGALAVKEKGGIWHLEAVKALAEPLKDRLVPDGLEAGRQLAARHPDQFAPDGRALNLTTAQELADKHVKPLEDWADRAVSNYLNKHAGTATDPLKDIVLPSGKRWEEVTDKIIAGRRQGRFRENTGAKEGETVWSVQRGYNASEVEHMTGREQAHNELTSYLSHVGGFLHSNVGLAKLPQYDLVRAVRETAANDARVAKEMEKSQQASTAQLPVYKEYPNGSKWVELKLPEKLTEEQARSVRPTKDSDAGVGFGQPENRPSKGGYVALDAKGKPIKNNFTGDIASGRTPEEAWLAGRLAEEGNSMGHCVGCYADRVASGETKIFSLRDAKGGSHVTVELQDTNKMSRDVRTDMPTNILQIKGKQNAAPVEKYLPEVQDFVRSGKWGEVYELENAKLLDIEGVARLIEIGNPGKGKKLIKRAREEGESRFVSKGRLAELQGFQARDAYTQREIDAMSPEEQARLNPQRGSIDLKTAATLAAVATGAAAGGLVNKDSPLIGAIIGGVGAGALARLSPGRAAQAVKAAFAPDTRIRINEFSNAHDAGIARAGRAIWQQIMNVVGKAPKKEDRVAITHAIQQGRTGELATPALRAAAEKAREFFAAMGKQGTESGVLKDTIENYVTNLWDLTGKNKDAWEQIVSRAGGPSMSPESRFALRRRIESLEEGKKLGLEPVTEDVAEIMGIYGNSLARSMENKKLITSLRAATVPGGDTKLLLPSKKAPQSYVTIEHPQLNGMRVHPDIAPSMKFLFENSAPGVVAAALEGVNTAIKRSAVSFSLFHARALTDAFVGAHGPLKGPVLAVKELAQATLPQVFGKSTLLKQLREGGAGDLVDQALGGGLKISFEKGKLADEDVGGSFYAGLKLAQKSLDSIVPGAGLPVAAVTKLNHAVDTFMWERLHAGMKLGVFADKLEIMRDANAKANARDGTALMTEEQLAAQAASFTNDIFGGLNWRKIAEEAHTKWGRDVALSVYSPKGRRVMQLLMFAPDWTISTTRAATRAFGSVLGYEKGSGVRGLLEPQNATDLHRQYMLRSAMYYAMAGEGLNYALSGHHIWENNDPTTIDMGDGRTMQWSKHSMEPVHWVTKPGQQALNKLGFFPKEAANQMLGTEYLSAKGTAPRMNTSGLGRLEHVGKSLLPIAAQQAFGSNASEGSGLAGFLGAPIYGRTREERARMKEKKKQERIQKRIDQRGY